MSRLYNTFEFVGNIHLPKQDKFHEVNPSASGWEGHRLNFAVQESKTNSVYVEMYGGYSKSKENKVFTFSKGTENEKGSKLEIPWEDRKNPETLDMVADFKKIVIDYTTDPEVKEKIGKLGYEIRTLEYKDQLTDEEKVNLDKLKEEYAAVAINRNEFISEYDAVVYLAETLEDFKNHKFRLTGAVEYNEWKGKFHRKFKPSYIEIVPNDEKSKLHATMDIFFTKDAVDDKDFKEDKKVFIDGYVLDYNRNAKKDMFYPQQFVINAQKLDFENKQHVGRFEFLKNKFNVKGKGVYHLQWIVNIFRGSDRVEFTEKDLTASQKEAIEFGFNKLEDFAPKGGMLGETVYENRLVKPVLEEVNEHNDFREGAVESTYEVDDLEFTFTQPEEQNIGTEEKIGDTGKVKVDVELDDLFA